MPALTGLRVTNIERIVLNLPLTPRQERITAREVANWSITELIRVETDAGLVGWGETILHYTWGKVSDAAIERVRGQNPARFLGDDTLGPGLQQAVYDVVGKALGVPAHRLLGAKVRDLCPISWWSIDTTPEWYAAEAAEAVAAGYTSLKIKHRPWFDIDAQVTAIDAATPEEFHLDVDANGFLVDAGYAIPVLKRLSQNHKVAIFETPIPQTDREGARKIMAQVDRPIAMHFGSPPFMNAVRDEVCDGFVVGGGVASILRQGTLAAEAQMPFFLQMVGTGLTTAMCFHLGAVLAQARWPAVTCVNLYQHPVVRELPRVQDGLVRVPEAPGLGVEVDEEAVSRYRMEPPHEKPKPRAILTVAWPNGRVIHYASIWQAWREFGQGALPLDSRGITMEERPDDGSREWAELWARAEQSPVHDRR